MSEVIEAVDFLAALACEPEIFETEGVKVEVRPLTFSEVQQIATKHKGDSAEMMFQALVRGLVKPQLSAPQLEQLRASRPGPLTKISNRIMEISGMMEGSGPLAGDGSLSSK